MTVTQKNKNWSKILVANLQELCSKEIAVGYPKGKAQAYGDGTKVAEVAAKNVYGIGVPQRDFMTYAERDINRDSKVLLPQVNQLANQGKLQAAMALLQALGMKAVTDIKNAILQGDWQPNSEATIARKNSARPLIDTGHMIGATTFDVRGKTTA